MDVDRIYCGDARHMKEVRSSSVQLIVTSPPYNVGKPYDGYRDSQELKEYLDFLYQVWRECKRVLCPGGRIAVNVANTYRQPYLPLHAYIARQFQRLGFLMRGEIIWDKGASAGVSTAWGSFARASNPVLRDVHEYILVFSKASLKMEAANGTRSGIANQDFVDWTRSIWRLPLDGQTEMLLKRFWDSLQEASSADTVTPAGWQQSLWDVLKEADKIPEGVLRSLWQFSTQQKGPHPAPFPVGLPQRLILLYTNRGDLVLDPFMGSGSTAVAAVREGRHYIGFDISPEYCAFAENRVHEEARLAPDLRQSLTIEKLQELTDKPLRLNRKHRDLKPSKTNRK